MNWPASSTITSALGEVTVVVKAADYAQAMLTLRDNPATQFDQLMDPPAYDALLKTL